MKRLALLTLTAMSMTAPAAASVHPTISPRLPIVDESITVKWKTDRVLKPNYHYQVSVVVSSGHRDDCAFLADKDSQRLPGKGRPMSMNFSPTDDWGSHSPSEWCRGKAVALVYIAKGDDGPINLIGSVDFRFRGKP
jgi:hypothetical protein